MFLIPDKIRQKLKEQNNPNNSKRLSERSAFFIENTLHLIFTVWAYACPDNYGRLSIISFLFLKEGKEKDAISIPYTWSWFHKVIFACFRFVICNKNCVIFVKKNLIFGKYL